MTEAVSGSYSPAQGWQQLESATSQSPPIAGLTEIGTSLQGQPPQVTGVQPSSGSTAGGTQVTISGANLLGATQVYFGANPATGFQVQSAGAITATVPPGSPGFVDVQVETSLGTSSPGGSDGFVYTSSGAYHPLTPARIEDTRAGSGLPGSGQAPGPGGVLDVQVAGVGGVPPTGAAGVLINLTVTDTTAQSYVTAFPAGVAVPSTSSIDFQAQDTKANLVEVALGRGGQISIYNQGGTTQVVVDVEGWYDSTGASGGPYVPLTPYRICDTRPPVFTPQNQCTGKTLQAGTTLTIQVAGTNPLGTTSGGVPASGVLAVDLTVTATNPTVPSYLTVWPAGATRPTASNLNFLGAETVANNVVVAVPQSGADAGEVSIYNANGSTDVVVDVSGYYATTTGPGLFVPMVPYRICDTRSTAISGLTDSCTGHTLVASGTSGAVLVLQVAGVGGIPANATSVVLNVTVTDTTAADYLTVYPDGSTRPNSSSLNWPAGETVASGVTATLGAGGALDFYIPQGAADLVVDVVGWEQ